MILLASQSFLNPPGPPKTSGNQHLEILTLKTYICNFFEFFQEFGKIILGCLGDVWVGFGKDLGVSSYTRFSYCFLVSVFSQVFLFKYAHIEVVVTFLVVKTIVFGHNLAPRHAFLTKIGGMKATSLPDLLKSKWIQKRPRGK